MATLWLSQGIPAKVVSERLGHANIAITLQLYGHVLPHMQADAAEHMDALVAPPRSTRHPHELLQHRRHPTTHETAEIVKTLSGNGLWNRSHCRHTPATARRTIDMREVQRFESSTAHQKLEAPPGLRGFLLASTGIDPTHVTTRGHQERWKAPPLA
jgi:hypothetical protein